MDADNEVLKEAGRLYALGFAIHWLRPKSKIPVEAGWTTGPRKPWKKLSDTFCDNYNVGVRLGAPSKLHDHYLAVVDIDVKSNEPRHLTEALKAAEEILGNCAFYPMVLSGRGGGSRHYYCLTEKPVRAFKAATSREKVKVHMPSVPRVSKAEERILTHDEVIRGIRIRPAWEVAVMGDGQQVVLPPSIHPDTGEGYRWGGKDATLSQIPLLKVEGMKTANAPSQGEVGVAVPGAAEGEKEAKLDGFKIAESVDISWIDISEEVRAAITDGTGVTDRSGYLLKASAALFSAGLSRNEVLTVLTDPTTFLGVTGYEHAKTNSRARAAAWVYRFTVNRVESERSVDGIFAGDIPKPRKLSPLEVAAVAEDFDSQRNWEQDIQRTQQGKPQKLVQNIHLIFSNAVAKDTVRRDEFAYRDSYSCDTPWGGKTGQVVSDDDIDEAQLWLGRNYGFEPGSNLIESALVVIARQNAYDPVKKFLDDLPDWDGTERLNGWLKKNFSAEGDAEYLSQVFRKWMVAMVMRGYLPGAKFDWMPIFEGTQGVGKSSFGRLLVGDAYFLDWLPNLNDKDAALSLQGMWGVEMGELSQFRGNALENIKAFITRTVDKIRPPYGKRIIESPRRCVFFGTTNRGNYLIDETGNRRFKPVEVGRLNFTALKTERLQLFAEAKMLWVEKEETESSLELTGAANLFELQVHNKKMVKDDSDAMVEVMLAFIDRVQKGEASFPLDRFRIHELFEGMGPFTKWKMDNRNQQMAGKMLRKIKAHTWPIKGYSMWKITEYCIELANSATLGGG